MRAGAWARAQRTPEICPPLQGAGKPKTYEGSWVQKLNQAGFSVTGVDLPGLGRSEVRCGP